MTAGRRVALALASWLAVGLVGESGRTQGLVVDVASHLVAVTTGFAGSEVVIFGTAEGPGEIVAVLRGPDLPAPVRRKERLAGIWYNGRAVTFETAPSFYRVVTNRPLDEIAPPEQRQRHRLGLDQIIPPGSPVRGAKRLDAAQIESYRQALIAARKLSTHYLEDSNKRITNVGGGLFRTSIKLPKTAPLGTYQVQVFLFRDGRLQGAQTTPLIVSKDGINADIVDFAQKWRLAYGVLSVLLAVGLGWGASIILKRF